MRVKSATTIPGVLLQIWGKTNPVHPCLYHMIDAGHVAQALLSNGLFGCLKDRLRDSMGCPECQLKAWVGFFVAAHDMGKCDARFQGYGPKKLINALLAEDVPFLEEWEFGFRHEAASSEWLLDFLLESVDWGIDAAHVVSSAVRGHHGRYEVPFAPEEEGLVEIWRSLRDALGSVLCEVFQINLETPWISSEFPIPSAAGTILLALIVLSDWIASNETLFPTKLVRQTLDENINQKVESLLDGKCLETTVKLQYYVKNSRDYALEAIQKLGFSNIMSWELPLHFRDVWPNFSIPHPVQAACESLTSTYNTPGITIIEAPTGEGKTEAAIYLAMTWLATKSWGGVYFALPTMATSNGMFQRFERFLERHQEKNPGLLKLVHGLAWMIDNDTPDADPNIENKSTKESALGWFRPQRRALLAPHGVGTIDQALMSVMHVKFGFLRLLGLSTKVLVIDEVHAYDAFMSEILVLLLRWAAILQFPVILLSASLPSERKRQLMYAYTHPFEKKRSENPQTRLKRDSEREDLEPYPLITCVDSVGVVSKIAVKGTSEGQQKTFEVFHHPGKLGNVKEIARLALERSGKVESGKEIGLKRVVCVLCNTVKMAQAVYDELIVVRSSFETYQSDPEQNIPLFLFHARFLARDRRKVEQTVLQLFGKEGSRENPVPEYRRPEQAILVATQVVEQSLDLDFDELISEPAPVDLLIQRMGRVHRHFRSYRMEGEQSMKPALHILWPVDGELKFGASQKVYQEFLLLRTWETLRGRDKLEFPRLVRELVETVYEPYGLNPNEPEDAEFSVNSKRLEVAWDVMQQEEVNQRAGPSPFLIPAPREREASLTAHRRKPFHEDDEESSSYFTAKTRLEKYPTTRVIILGEIDYPQLLERTTSPERKHLQDILMRYVNLPAWWFRSTTPIEGYSAITPAPGWLPGYEILRLTGGIWQAQNRDGKICKLQVSPERGITFEYEVSANLINENGVSGVD